MVSTTLDILIISKERAILLETSWIILLRSYDPEVGYNLTFGGEGGCPTQEVRARMSAYAKQNGHGKWNKGRPSPHRGKRLSWVSRSNRWRKGKTIVEQYGEEKSLLLRKQYAKGAIRHRRVFRSICYSCFHPFKLSQRNDTRVFCSRVCFQRAKKELSL